MNLTMSDWAPEPEGSFANHYGFDIHTDTIRDEYPSCCFGGADLEAMVDYNALAGYLRSLLEVHGTAGCKPTRTT